MSNRAICALGLLLGIAAPVLAQDQGKVYDWQPANDESVRMDPANYHTGRTYRPGPQGGSIHVDIEAQQPVTIGLTAAGDWNAALQRSELIGSLNYLCLREHVVKTTYLCDLPAQPMTLVIRDERNNPDRAVFAGLGAVLDPHDKVDHAVGVGIVTIFTGEGSPTRRFAAPNDIHIQYYRWACVSNCIQPEFQWIRQAKEKYELTSFLKVYNGIHAGARRPTGQCEDQVSCADGGSPYSVKCRRPAPWQNGRSRNRAGKQSLPAARCAKPRISVQLQRRGRPASADRRP
jgi:hypothetical protein